MVLFKGDYVEKIANDLNISKKVVDDVIGVYGVYIQNMLNAGKSMKFLNVCHINCENEDDYLNTMETLAYVATDIANLLGIGSVTVQRIFSALEDIIVDEVASDNGFCLRGVVRIRCVKNDEGERRVRVKKSVKYNGEPIRISTFNSFRRKVEAYGR